MTTDRLREAAEEALSHLVIGSAGSDLDEHRVVTRAIEILRATLAEQPKRVPLTDEARGHALHMIQGHQTYHREYIVAAALLRAYGITGDGDEQD